MYMNIFLNHLLLGLDLQWNPLQRPTYVYLIEREVMFGLIHYSAFSAAKAM